MDRKESRTGNLTLGRRDFFKIGGALGVAAGLSVRDAEPASAQDGVSPVIDVALLGDIQPGAEIEFFYPDENSPAVLLRLNAPAEGGIGPNESIVAYSILCTHKGCPVQFKPDRHMFICPCHWSSFDPAKAGRLIIGHASESLPQINLRVQDGKVQATGVNGLIFGRHTNIL